ncbi:glucose-induced degradation complex subunit GID7 [Ascoidea rubescens DSM 1968]|uniref:WD40 repeat-like protein n=1 Tax=Ascoidea rubescens DSM 1968 TaxID=1344418 RepID=A0A1D2VBS4_9ASCO|nr:WD40 repeat-like protein [Ascoidea rubescens DSM 1968]ODV59061.1 WD40 repeat-like protein [Ascoidea rubescens DSM 1968]
MSNTFKRNNTINSILNHEDTQRSSSSKNPHSIDINATATSNVPTSTDKTEGALTDDNSLGVTSLLFNLKSTKSLFDIYSKSKVSKAELTNLLLQTLNDLGYKNTFDTLKNESKIALNPTDIDSNNTDPDNKISNFIKYIQIGDFDKAEDLIPFLSFKTNYFDTFNTDLIYPVSVAKSINNNIEDHEIKKTNAKKEQSSEEILRKLELDTINVLKTLTKSLIKRHKLLESLFLHNDVLKSTQILMNEINFINLKPVESFFSISNVYSVRDFINDQSLLLSLILNQKLILNYSPTYFNIKELISFLQDNGFFLNLDFNKSYNFEELSQTQLHSMLKISRSFLINKLSKFLNYHQLIPPHRLLSIINQARLYQESRNLITLGYIDDPNNSLSNYSVKNNNSLFEDFQFPLKKFPNKILQTLDFNSVSFKTPRIQSWFVKFSNNGKYLATTTTSGIIYIHQVSNFNYFEDVEDDQFYNSSSFKLVKRLVGHKKNVSYLSWSSNDEKLLSSDSCRVKVWNLISGKCESKIHIDVNPEKSKNKTTSSENSNAGNNSMGTNINVSGSGSGSGNNNNNNLHHNEEDEDEDGDESSNERKSTSKKSYPRISSCVWLPNSAGFVLGSPEKEIIYFDANTFKEKFRISTHRINDLCISKDSNYLIGITSDQCIGVWSLKTHQLIKMISVGKKLTSLTVSRLHPSHVLINVLPDSIQLWDWAKGILLKKFVGQQQENHIIRSCFGGINESLVLSGSEDGRIYIWNKKYSALILALKGHNEVVNCVDFNPKVPWMFASASDDFTVKIWGSEDALAEKKRYLNVLEGSKEPKRENLNENNSDGNSSKNPNTLDVGNTVNVNDTSSSSTSNINRWKNVIVDELDDGKITEIFSKDDDDSDEDSDADDNEIESDDAANESERGNDNVDSDGDEIIN